MGLLSLAQVMVVAAAAAVWPGACQPPGRCAEGMSWLTTAASVGSALGAPLAGRLIDAHAASAGYLFAFAAGLAAVAIVVLGLRGSRAAQATMVHAQTPGGAGIGHGN
jgi:MFS family permease